MKQTKYGIEAQWREDFTQAQYEQYQTRLLELAKDATAAAVVERAMAQAAIDSGILSGIKTPLMEQPPRVVRWLTVQTRDFINQQLEVESE